MKPERQMLILFTLIGVMILCWYLHSLQHNNWRQAPVPHRAEPYEQYRERVDSVMRPYVDSSDMKMKFRIEGVNP